MAHHKLTKKAINFIITGEINFRPRYLTAKLAEIDVDTIASWIEAGKNLLKTDTQILFEGAEEEKQLLLELVKRIEKGQTLSQISTWDEYFKTGKKDQLKIFVAKEGISQKPEQAVEIALQTVQIFDKQDTPPLPPPNRKILDTSQIIEIENKMKKGKK